MQGSLAELLRKIGLKLQATVKLAAVNFMDDWYSKNKEGVFVNLKSLLAAQSILEKAGELGISERHKHIFLVTPLSQSIDAIC